MGGWVGGAIFSSKIKKGETLRELVFGLRGEKEGKNGPVFTTYEKRKRLKPNHIHTQRSWCPHAHHAARITTLHYMIHGMIYNIHDILYIYIFSIMQMYMFIWIYVLINMS
jgi:hypothetical protein